MYDTSYTWINEYKIPSPASHPPWLEPVPFPSGSYSRPIVNVPKKPAARGHTCYENSYDSLVSSLHSNWDALHSFPYEQEFLPSNSGAINVGPRIRTNSSLQKRSYVDIFLKQRGELRSEMYIHISPLIALCSGKTSRSFVQETAKRPSWFETATGGIDHILPLIRQFLDHLKKFSKIIPPSYHLLGYFRTPPQKLLHPRIPYIQWIFHEL